MSRTIRYSGDEVAMREQRRLARELRQARRQTVRATIYHADTFGGTAGWERVEVKA